VIFIDASALVAALAPEPDATAINGKIVERRAVTSPIALWETARALARINGTSLEAASRHIAAYLETAGVTVVPIGQADSVEAMRAQDRFGKGQHPAALNMGDCFAYACARTHGAALLFKGEDFAQTDIEAA